ncbi:hypothetical protein BTUL_0115g00290 [Botrytis tulipae]|uniref:Uncharacterized protein n=1 Tax=Botrytis tulipae TaxID=87230 RepID=A0A4Z1EIB9_9HELO|nr:hypothetical protein BTUL_0115g00290 [Botrytis tulipae]
MASKTEKTILEASMGRYMRVLRNHNTLEELIAAYPSLEEKCLSCPSALTDEERRVFLDLPDLDMETANIRAATALSREELIEKAVKDPSSLTQEEKLLLLARFWTPKTDAERKVTWELLCKTEEIIMGEEGAAFYASRNPAFLPNELKSFHAGSREWYGWLTCARKMQANAMAEAAPPDAPEWIRRLYREGKDLWGRTFREILQDPLQYEQRVDVPPRTLFGGQRRFDLYKDGLASSGINTNTFLVFDRICMASVLESGGLIESMRIRAFEADYPVPGKTYVEGYQGYTWVRLDQLVYNFYELRSMKAEKVGMDEILQAAQQSRNAAFVSLDTKEAGNWTPSNPMGGLFPDSVLGKRRYANKEPLN